MKYYLSSEDVEIDNRDDNTTEIVLPNGDRLEVTKDGLIALLYNMIENAKEE